MQEHDVQLDCYVNLEGVEDDAALQHILSSQLVEHVVRQTLLTVGLLQPVTISLVITDDAEIQSLNLQYRHQNKPTDVLSFPLLDAPLVQAPADELWQADEDSADVTPFQSAPFVTPPEMATNLGDIMISWPTVQRQAREAHHSPVYELLYLLAHGVLHLVGYDDQTEAGYRAMVRLQEAVLQDIQWDIQLQ